MVEMQQLIKYPKCQLSNQICLQFLTLLPNLDRGSHTRITAYVCFEATAVMMMMAAEWSMACSLREDGIEERSALLVGGCVVCGGSN